jgi:hypothetical protein
MHVRAYVWSRVRWVSACVVVLLCTCTPPKAAPRDTVQRPSRQVSQLAVELAGCWRVTNRFHSESSRHDFDSVSIIGLDGVLESQPGVYSAHIHSGARPIADPIWFQPQGSDSIIVRVNSSTGWSLTLENGQLVGLIQAWSKWIEPPTGLVAHLGYARAVPVACPT